IARNMVTKWGLSTALGPLNYHQENEEVFLGRQISKHHEFSDETSHLIDQESRLIINRNYKLAESLLIENLGKLHLMAEALMKYETIDPDQIEDIMQGRVPREPHGWQSSPLSQKMQQKVTSRKKPASSKQPPPSKDTPLPAQDSAAPLS